MKQKPFQKVLAGALVVSLSYSPTMANTPTTQPLSKQIASYSRVTLLKGISDVIDAKYSRVLAKVPENLLQEVDLQGKIRLAEQTKEKINALKNKNISLQHIRKEALLTAAEDIREQKKEVFYQLHNLSNDELDLLAQKLKGNPYYSNALLDYDASYTRTEKANALASAAYRDLDNVLSLTIKRSTTLNREDWIRDLQASHDFYNEKAMKKWVKYLIISGLIIGTTGLVTWAVANSKYKGKYEKKKAELESKFQDLKRNLEASYNSLQTRLNNDEQNFLKENGFVYTTCKTYEQPDSILCNRFNYQTFSGTKYCSVRCYRNPQTGQETLHEAPVCTSPFVPANCYDPNEYQNGYNKGKNEGYDDGYDDGIFDGKEDGREEGHRYGYNRGYDEGYDRGYRLGYDRGSADAPDWEDDDDWSGGTDPWPDDDDWNDDDDGPSNPWPTDPVDPVDPVDPWPDDGEDPHNPFKQPLQTQGFRDGYKAGLQDSKILKAIGL